MKIAILDDYQNLVPQLACFSLLAGHEVTVLNESFTEPAGLAARIGDAEVLVLIRERTRIDAALLQQLPALKLISQTGKVSGHINLADCRAAGVLVCEGSGSPRAPAELCWALVLAASRNLLSYCQALQEGQWQQSGPAGIGRTLHGLCFGIWGYGKIGRIVARYAEAFGMQVLVWGSDDSRRAAQQDGFTAAVSKDELFRTADILSLHLRLSERSRHCVRRADLALMKADSLLVNTSRAELIEPDALYRELLAKPGKRAAVDVYEHEPAGPHNEALLSLPNVLCAPHLGYVEKGNYELYFRIAFENVLAWAAGQPANIVDGCPQ